MLGGGFLTSAALCGCHAIWWSHRGWGGIEYLIYFGPFVLGWLNFAAIWAALGDDRPVVQWGILPLAIAGLSLGLVRAISDEYALLVEMVKMYLMALLPALLLRRRGLGLTRRLGESSSRWSWLSFSIADLLIATTGFAALLGLAMIEEPVWLDLLYVFSFAAPMFFVLALGFAGRKRWLALVLLCAPCALLVGGALLESLLGIRVFPPMLGADFGVMLLIGGIQLVVQTFAAGVLRRLGYRLQAVG